MSLYPEIENLDLERLITCFQKDSLDGEENTATYYTEVALLIKQKGENGIAFLKTSIDSVNTEQLRAIIFVLSCYQGDDFDFLATLKTYLSDRRPLIVAEAIDGLTRQESRDDVDLVLALREHSSPYVRGSVLRYMNNLYPDRSLPILIEALQDPSFIVRENAVDELGELGMIEVLPNLRPLLLDRHPDVRQATQFAIEVLESNSSQ
jgi:hypothetical protein